MRRAEAGIRPGGRPPFLCATRKEAKKRAPQPAAPAGQPAPGCLRGAPHNSLRCCAAAFRQMRRVRSRSGCVLRHTRHPASTPPQAQPEGGGSPKRAVAALGLACAAHSACGPLVPSAAMARGDFGSQPLLYAPAARRGWRIRARDCLSAAGASSSETPPAPSTAGCPQRSAGTQTAGSPFFWVLFFGEAKNKYLARRGETRPAPSAKRTVTTRPCMGSSPPCPSGSTPIATSTPPSLRTM